MRVFEKEWSSVATSGGQDPLLISGDPLQSAWFFKTSTGVSSVRFSVQSGLSTTGPWAEEAASTAGSSGTLTVLRVNGPFKWVRPFCGSTGMTVRAIGS